MRQQDYSFLRSKRIVYLVNVDQFLISHRLPLALTARDAGAEVIVAAGDTGRGGLLEREGLRFVPIPFPYQGTNILHEVSTVRSIYRFLKEIRPDLLHAVSIKPVLYGSLLSRLFGSWPVVNAVSGLGYVFSQDKKASLLRKGIFPFYKFALGNPRSMTIFQNPFDRDTLLKAGCLAEEQTVLIRGSGVDCDLFHPSSFPEKPLIMLPARMLWDKGVGEFVRAADLLHPQFPEARFVLVGPAGHENPKSISEKQLREWASARPYLEWWGEKEPGAMHGIVSQATIIALPSFYPEGLPKSLLEGAACGKPLIASNIPACREIVREGVNGTMVPPRDAGKLADAIATLLRNPGMMKAYGERGRAIACDEFREESVVDRTFEVYGKMLDR